MRKVIVYSVLALVLGTVLWKVMAHDPGYILIVVAGKTVEMSVAFAVVALLAVLLGLYWLLGLLKGSARLIRRGWRATAGRRALRAELHTQRGLLHFIEGNWVSAQKELLKAARHTPKPLIHYLAAARSSYELGDESKAKALLAQAAKISPENELAVSVSQARMLLRDRQYEAGLSILLRAKTAAPHNVVVLDLLHQAYLGLSDWASLELLLPELRSYKVLPEAHLNTLEKQVYLSLLHHTGKNMAMQQRRMESNGVDVTANLEALNEVWGRMPKLLRNNAEIIGVYAQYLVVVGQDDKAETVLRAGLKQEWLRSLVELYGLTNPSDRAGQLQYAQKWLVQHPEDGELELALGRICLRNQLWGQARDHFLKSISLRPTPAAYAELGRLLAHLGEHKQSTDYFQRGLLLTTHGLPELPMPNR